MLLRTRAGFYRQETNGTVWDVPERYSDLIQIGTGAYGTVCSAADHKTGERVAIKKLHRPFQSRLFAKRAYRELRLLKHMKHANVVGLLDVFTSEILLDRFQDFYLVMPFMGTDLGKLMKMQRLSEDRVQFLVYQILRGLKVRHRYTHNHICEDLKPGNLAVNQDCELKILDFGLARQADSEMTGYVVSRWYRAPEVILNWMHYSQTVDIWSVGCIMAEMLLGRPLFKGNDYLDQLREIIKITGTPPPYSTIKLQSQYVSVLHIIRNTGKIPFFCYTVSVNCKSYLCLMSVFFSAVNALEQMLVLDPDKRVSTAEALELPLFTEFREPEEETEALPYDHSMDNTEMPLDQWKRHTFTEILLFQPPITEIRDSKEIPL
uniref:mitogen-activated protein kinase n=1 Tax=Cyprinus carpio TaxID=7962 RepID=A0A8C2GWQ4_CYPCA